MVAVFGRLADWRAQLDHFCYFRQAHWLFDSVHQNSWNDREILPGQKSGRKAVLHKVRAGSGLGMDAGIGRAHWVFTLGLFVGTIRMALGTGILE